MCVQCTIVSVEHNEYVLWSLCSNAVAGESALDRMACGLGGKLVLPMIKEHIMQMLQNRKLDIPKESSVACFSKSSVLTDA